jgi:hypothetical protein
MCAEQAGIVEMSGKVRGGHKGYGRHGMAWGSQRKRASALERARGLVEGPGGCAEGPGGSGRRRKVQEKGSRGVPGQELAWAVTACAYCINLVSDTVLPSSP